MRTLLLLAVASTVLGLHQARAQENETALTATTHSIVTREPYSPRHIGSPQQASVLVHVVDQIGRVLRTGNGFMVRCDGFFLVLETLLPRDGNLGAKILVSAAQAEGETLTEPLAAVGPTRFYGKKNDYVLLKVNGHDLPCLPLLDANRNWFAKHWFAMQNPPVDFYPQDVSRYGVRNIWLGPPEIVVPNTARRTTETAWKPSIAKVDPYLSFFTCTWENDPLTFAGISWDDVDALVITFFRANRVACYNNYV